MPIDPAGTTPGVKPSVEEPKEVHLKCKTETCDSILATEIKIAGQMAGSHMYRCVKCSRTWSIRTGGGVDLG